MRVNDIVALTLFTLGITGFVASIIGRTDTGMVISAILTGYAMGIYADRAR